MTIFILYIILYLITTTGIFFVATLVFLRQNNRLNKSFAIFTTFLGLWVLLQFVAQLTHELAPPFALGILNVTLALPAFFGVEFYHFVLRYTGKLSTTQNAPWWDYIFPLIMAGTIFIPGLMYDHVLINEVGIVVSGTVAYYILVIIVAGYIVLGVKHLLHYLRRGSNRDAHYRTAFLLWGVVVATCVILGAILFLPDVIWSQISIPGGALGMVSLFGYAIVKHRLFDIRLIVVRLLAYLLSLLVVAGLYALLAFVIFAQLLNVEGMKVGQELSFVLIALVLALTFAPLKRFFDRITKAIFYQDAYDTQQVLDDIGTVLVSKVDIKRLVRESLTLLRAALKSQYITIVLIDTESGGIERTIGIGRGPQLTDVYPSIVRQAATMVVTDELDANQDAALYRALQKADVGVVVSLETSKELIGYVVYGTKANGRIYSSDDLKLIRITTDGLAVGVQNALRFEEISHFNETLQAQVREATAELRASNKKLKSLDEAKDEFISMASHQLRTPLTSVKGYMSMVLEGDAGKLNPTQYQLLEQAFASSQRMVYLISDFLNVSRLQTGKFTIERTPVILSNVVQQEANQLKSTAESRNLTIECNVPANFPVLQLDESKLRQAIMNFIDNAIFYSRPGSVIKVDLVKTAHDVALTVQDSGIGVPQSERHHLFTKFYRASNARTARPDGTGIGLFMAKKVVVAHGGSIIFNSVEGKGSTFGFRLPLKQPALTETHQGISPKELAKDQMKELK